MPYEWHESDGKAELLRLWPHRSLPKRGFVWFIAVTAVFLAMPLLAVIGKTALWVLLPFLLAALGALWWALSHSYRDGEVLEELRLFPDRIELIRRDPHRPPRHWEANPYWVRAEIRASGGPMEQYLTLEGGPRAVELGTFLTPDERRSLWAELHDRLAEARPGA